MLWDHATLYITVLCSQLNTEWAQVEVIDLINDGSGLGFGIIGGRSTGVVVKTILPGGVADRVSTADWTAHQNHGKEVLLCVACS